MSGLASTLLAYFKRLKNSLYFAAAGAIGGLIGVVGNELYIWVYNSTVEVSIVASAYYFAVFAGCVGLALGITEGLLLGYRLMAAYGAAVGLVLGLLGGYVGGSIGQALFSLFPPQYSSSTPQDFVIALDSSGSMVDSDPLGKRKAAAKRLISRMGPHQKLAIVDFDQRAEVIYPLLPQTSSGRAAAKRALKRIDDAGGTDLTVALQTSLSALSIQKDTTSKRKKNIIILTDGMGEFDLSLTKNARKADVSVYVIGLGQFVQPEVLKMIATSPDKYYSVEEASSLASVFSQIYQEAVRVTDHIQEKHGEAVLVSNPLWLFSLRVICWGIIGLMIGLGQGFRENKKEELVWCSIGGAIGGFLGGMTFDYMAVYLDIDTVSRISSGVVVGFFIGGALRLTQQGMTAKTNDYISLDDEIRFSAGGLVVVEEDDVSPKHKMQTKKETRGMLTFLPTKEDFMKGDKKS